MMDLERLMVEVEEWRGLPDIKIEPADIEAKKPKWRVKIEVTHEDYDRFNLYGYGEILIEAIYEANEKYKGWVSEYGLPQAQDPRWISKEKSEIKRKRIIENITITAGT